MSKKNAVVLIGLVLTLIFGVIPALAQGELPQPVIEACQQRASGVEFVQDQSGHLYSCFGIARTNSAPAVVANTNMVQPQQTVVTSGNAQSGAIQVGNNCRAINDYPLHGQDELSVEPDGFLHVQWWVRGLAQNNALTPEHDTVLLSGRYSIAAEYVDSENFRGHVWEYHPDCTVEDVMAQIDASIQRRVQVRVNTVGFWSREMLFDTGIVSQIENTASQTDQQALAQFEQTTAMMTDTSAQSDCQVTAYNNGQMLIQGNCTDQEIADQIMAQILGVSVEQVQGGQLTCTWDGQTMNCGAQTGSQPTIVPQGANNVQTGGCPNATRMGPWSNSTDLTVQGPAIVSPWGGPYGEDQLTTVVPHGETYVFHQMKGEGWQYAASCSQAELERQARNNGLIYTPLEAMSSQFVQRIS